MNYIYVGILDDVNQVDIILTDPYVVLNTGDFSSPFNKFRNVQKLPVDRWGIKVATIESYGLVPEEEKDNGV